MIKKKTESKKYKKAGVSKRAALYQHCKHIAKAPDILAELRKALSARGIVGDLSNCLIVYLAVTSRLFVRPVSLVLKGASSAGKSEVVDAVLPFFPPSAFIPLTSGSDRSLVYSSEPFSHRVIVVHEETGISDAMATSLRVLQSQGFIVHQTAMPKKGGGFETQEYRKDGPVGVITTTTKLSLHPENETRMLSLHVPDSEERTKAVMVSIASDKSDVETPGDWQTFQEWVALGPMAVDVPFGKCLAQLTRGICPRMARDFSQVLVMVKVHALLHRKNRARSGDKIKASIADYRAVWKLLKDVVAEGVEAQISNEVRQTVRAVEKLVAQGNTVNLADLAVVLGLHKSSACRRVSTALKAGYLHHGERGPRGSFNIVPGDPLPDDVQVLPTPKQLRAHYRCETFKGYRKAKTRTGTPKSGSVLRPRSAGK